ncbi:MAG: glycosyltransferase family 4 protein [Armatimonadota bacterium]
MSAQGRDAIHIIMLGPALDVRGGVSSVEKLILAHAPAGIKIRHIATMRDGSALYKLFVFLGAVARFIPALLVGHVDLVHIHFASRASTWRKSVFAMLAQMAGEPYILHAHGGEFRDFYSRQPRVLQRWIARMLRRSRRLIALSEGWKQYYTGQFGLPSERVAVLPNPVDMPSTPPSRGNRSCVTLLFLGRMGHIKGATRVVQALSALPEEVLKRAHLAMAGDGNVESVRQEVSNLGLDKQVTVMDWVTAEQRNTLFASADIFVLPSLNEGLPMSVLEAMSWGLPVITSPVGGIPEVVQHGVNGLLVPPTDIPAIAQAMQELIENEPLRLQMGINARSSVEHLDIAHYWQKLYQIYQSVLAEQGK